MEIKLGTSPASFSFEIEYESGDSKGEGVVKVNFYEINAQMRLDGVDVGDDGPRNVDKEYIEGFVKSIRKVARPSDLIAKLTDAQVYAIGNECFLLFSAEGNESAPSQTLPRPTELSTPPPA